VNTTTGGVEIPASDYVLQRYPPAGGSPVTVTPSCSGTGMITCTESSVPDGTWQYTDTPTYAANWVGTESAKSGPVAVSTTATVSVTYPVDSTSYGADWSAMITGTASPGAGATVKSTQVAIEDTTTNQWWKGTSFNDATQNFVTANGTTTWYLPFGAGNLTSGDSYSVIAETKDSAGNIGTSSTVAFTYGTATTATTVRVTYPVDSTSYGADWTGTITGTASSAAGTTITATAMVAIEDTSATRWWNGTAFAASSQTFVAATGNTTWLLALGTGNLTSGDRYSVVAQATDSAGDVGTSSKVSFTYGTTTTTSTTTTTTPPTTSTTTTTTPPTTSTTTTTTPPTTTTTTAATPPTVSVTYPVDSTTYGADWTGTITGTASSNSGASTTIASTQVAIEDTTADQWWNGTSFSASNQNFVAASGTASWSLALGAGSLTSGDNYSVVAQATDSASNVGTSSTVSFTYGSTTTTTTPPTTTTTTAATPPTTSTTTATTPPTTSTTTTSLASA
jgi:hypothetical protein